MTDIFSQNGWRYRIAEESLRRAGVFTERAVQASRSITQMERDILDSARYQGQKAGFSPKYILSLIWEGRTDRSLVLAPLKVTAKFSYYEDYSQFGIKPIPSIFIIESNHPALTPGGNVSVEDLQKAGIKLPKIPSYEKWVKMGKPVYRWKSK